MCFQLAFLFYRNWFRSTDHGICITYSTSVQMTAYFRNYTRHRWKRCINIVRHGAITNFATCSFWRRVMSHRSVQFKLIRLFCNNRFVRRQFQNAHLQETDRERQRRVARWRCKALAGGRRLQTASARDATQQQQQLYRITRRTTGVVTYYRFCGIAQRHAGELQVQAKLFSARFSRRIIEFIL